MSADWRMAAACREEDPELHFPVADRAQATAAKAVCGICRSRDACLAFALKTRQEYGIWGGLDERQRAAILRRETRQSGRRRGGGRKLAACGTDAAYRRHVAKGEPIDDLCAQAREDEKARRRRAKWTTPAGAA
jgi:WhiB family redox-sensing transcriptional regulator